MSQEGPTHSEEESIEPIKTIAEFLQWVEDLEGSQFLYRGLGDSKWDVKSSALRRLNPKGTVHPAVFENYVRNLLDKAKLRGHGRAEGILLSDLELLAELQHYGSATCLIDFTKASLVALWFACNDLLDTNGKVVSLCTDSTDDFGIINSEQIKESIETFLDEQKLWQWSPSDMNNRIIAQQSVFIFGKQVISSRAAYYYEVEIDDKSKNKILKVLEKIHGITEESLFRDLSGFALSNSYDKEYKDYSAEDYFNMGLRLQQQSDFENAISYYDQAIGKDKKYHKAYNQRGIAKRNIKDYEGAIKDYDEAIKLDSDNITYYNNRGFAKGHLNKYKEAIEDYDKAIDKDSKYIPAYRNRGIARSNLEDYEGAINDYDEVIKISPNIAEYYNERGIAKSNLGDYKGAVEDYNKAIELEDDNIIYYNNRRKANIKLGNESEAKKDRDMIMKLNPDFFENSEENLEDV